MAPPPRRLRIGITGASGFLGRRLIEIIVKAGHVAVGFSRNPEKKLTGCAEMRVFAPGQIDLSALDAVIHLAGESVFGRWTRRKKERILSSRRDGTRALVDAILAARKSGQGPRTLVSASAIGFYGDTGEEEVDESTPAGSGFLAEVTQTWEAEAVRARSGGVRVVILRFGIVLGREGGALALLRPMFLLGLGAKLGTGEQWVSWIHAGDAAGMALFCIENPLADGIFNSVAPAPLRNREFTEALARKWNRKARLTIPAFALRAVLGEFAETLLTSQRVLPLRTLELGYPFHCREL